MTSPNPLQRGADWIGSHQRRVLLAGFGVVTLLWAFVLVVGTLVEGDPHAFDEWLLLRLRSSADPSLPVGGVIAAEVARDITALGGVTVLGIVTGAVGIAFGLQGRPGAMWLLFGATAGGAIASTALKALFDRQRPGVVPHLTEVLTASFPSGHAMLGAVVYLTLGVLVAEGLGNRWARAWTLLVAMGVTVLVGASRVFLGVHYPTDVLAGWVAGMAWALGCWLLARWLAASRRA